MTVRLVLAVLFGFGLGFPVGIFLECKAREAMNQHEAKTKAVSLG